MRNSRWLFGLARTLAVVGALGLGSAVAWAEDESDADTNKDRTSESRDDDTSDRSDRDDDSESRKSDSSSDDSEERSSRARNQERDRSDRDESDSEDSDRSSTRAQRDRNQDRSSQQTRSDRNRNAQDSDDEGRDSRTQRSSNQQQEFGVEFEAGETNRLTVSSIEDDSIAQRARLAEDDVIISVDGRSFNDARQLTRYLQSVGQRRVPIIIERDGRRYTVQLQGVADRQFAQSRDQSGAWLGVYLDDNEDGAVITQVYPQGPAARAGLRRGDVVVQFNGEDVTDSEELVEWIERENPNSRARFTVLRDNREMQLTATLADRDQFIARLQNQNQNQNQQYAQNQYSQDQYSQNQQYSQRQDRQNRGFQDDDRQNQGSSRQDREFVEYNQQRNDNRGYSSYNYPGRSNQQQDARQGSDQIQRLERMVRELQEEVRDLREQMENR